MDIYQAIAIVAVRTRIDRGALDLTDFEAIQAFRDHVTDDAVEQRFERGEIDDETAEACHFVLSADWDQLDDALS
ncbi:hypothetical protein [Kutzneria buriramensis]|uniref:Uncharacterized protein n=1 Tax=Kutzneria buriramensis TaxID=1045776 RepID=A0A3E0G5J5_9PSEU|nr:hypothetical protein [Kutzneria buriramensis]REH18079.1 hypothetical protein BCF44_13866 [Kutzneria buriramensis]